MTLTILLSFSDLGAVTDISSTKLVNNSNCISKFDFTRIDNVRAFSVIYMVQGRSWYTKWLTVLESVPIFTRFQTFAYTDNGGSLNIRVKMDTDLNSHSSEIMGFYHIVKGCLSRGREPRVISNTGELACDNHSSTLKVANLDNEVIIVSPIYYLTMGTSINGVPLFLVIFDLPTLSYSY